MVKRRRKTKFIKDLLPIYSNKPHPTDPTALAFFPVLRFDCNMRQLPGEIQWISY